MTISGAAQVMESWLLASHSTAVVPPGRNMIMLNAMPLFESSELASVKAQCEELSRKLQRGGVDAQTRIRREQRLRQLRAEQMRLEIQLGLGGAK
ncbi:UNVERIFIED_ORG: hypothetical protein BTE55_18445 [Rhizobium sophorae]